MLEHVGREVEIKAHGMTWKFARWSIDTWEDFTAYAQKVLPDPIAVAAKSLDVVQAKDAETLRKIIQADIEEEKKARAENRDPVLMASRFKPMSEVLVEKAVEKASSYLGFNSPEIMSLLTSPVGLTYLFRILLLPHHPEISKDDAYAIMQVMTADEHQRVLYETQGKVKATAKNG